MVTFSTAVTPNSYFRPLRFEGDVFDCEVQGEIPSGLQGAFYRLHGDWFYPPAPGDIPLAADGYVSMFRFRAGRVDYRGRYVHTQRYQAQRAAGRQLYGRYRNPFTDDVSVQDAAQPHLRTTANTTPLVHAGKLYATKEDGLPHELNPNTLETLGPTDFAGRWKSQTFTAHAKTDPVSGELAAFGYEASGLCSREVFAALFNRSGAIDREWRFEVPYTSLIHDMAITEKHLILPGGGCVTDMDRLRAGKVHWGWDSRKPCFYGILPRDGEAKDLRWFLGPERSIVHTANAYSVGDKVVLDAPMANGNTWPWFEDVAGGQFKLLPNIIRRITFDMSSKNDRCTEEILFDRPVTSFTRIDERFMGRPYRYIYVQYFDADKPARAGKHPEMRYAANSFGRFDTHSGALQSCFLGETHIVQEPTFVPRPGTTEEGAGWLVGTVHNPAEMRSELAIVDATNLREVARVLLPFITPSQVHGTWAGDDQLPLS